MALLSGALGLVAHRRRPRHRSAERSKPAWRLRVAFLGRKCVCTAGAVCVARVLAPEAVREDEFGQIRALEPIA
jgi:hypothetical protein